MLHDAPNSTGQTETTNDAPNLENLHANKHKAITTIAAAPPKVRLGSDDDAGKLAINISDASLMSGLERAFGTDDLDSIKTLLGQLRSLVSSGSKNLNELNLVLATLYDIHPKDGVERLLAVQMAATHMLAMDLSERTRFSPDPRQREVNLNGANKLMRTFTTQIEALNRHRGKVAQSMVVENVNVNQGGQAIVGPMNRTPSEREPQDDERKSR